MRSCASSLSAAVRFNAVRFSAKLNDITPSLGRPFHLLFFRSTHQQYCMFHLRPPGPSRRGTHTTRPERISSSAMGHPFRGAVIYDVI